MSLSEAQKAVVSLVFFGAAAVALFVAFDPNLTQALATLVGAGFGVATVFSTANATENDWSKAAAQLQAAAISVVGFFATVPTETGTKITTVIVAGISAYFVWKKRNGPAPTY